MSRVLELPNGVLEHLCLYLIMKKINPEKAASVMSREKNSGRPESGYAARLLEWDTNILQREEECQDSQFS